MAIRRVKGVDFISSLPSRRGVRVEAESDRIADPAGQVGQRPSGVQSEMLPLRVGEQVQLDPEFYPFAAFPLGQMRLLEVYL